MYGALATDASRHCCSIMSDGEIIVYIFWRKMNKLAGRHTAKETPALEESAEEGRGKGSEKKKGRKSP